MDGPERENRGPRLIQGSGTYIAWSDHPQAAETVRQRRSRIVQTLNVPQRVRLGPSLTAALLDELFEHPAGIFRCCAARADLRTSRVPI